MWFIGKKEGKVIESFKQHLKAVEETLEKLEDMVNLYLDGRCDEVDDIADEVISLETKADKIRRETETMMYSGAFLPNFRGDLLGLIESIDKIANKAEMVAKVLSFQRPLIPDELKSDVRKQIRLSIDTYKAFKDTVEEMFEDMEKASKMVQKVEKKEHEEDVHEWNMMKKLFSLEISRALKLEIKEIITSIGDLADLAEDASDRVEIIILKRRV